MLYIPLTVESLATDARMRAAYFPCRECDYPPGEHRYDCRVGIAAEANSMSGKTIEDKIQKAERAAALWVDLMDDPHCRGAQLNRAVADYLRERHGKPE